MNFAMQELQNGLNEMMQMVLIYYFHGLKPNTIRMSYRSAVTCLRRYTYYQCMILFFLVEKVEEKDPIFGVNFSVATFNFRCPLRTIPWHTQKKFKRKKKIVHIEPNHFIHPNSMTNFRKQSVPHAFLTHIFFLFMHIILCLSIILFKLL